MVNELMSKARSWWGWGTIEDALSTQERSALLKRVSELLPDLEQTAHEPPDVASLVLAPIRISAPPSLDGLCSADPVDRASHSHGKAFRDVVRNLHGALDNVPDLIARPRTEADVIDLLDWCTRDKIAVIAYGGGSSVVGGIEPRFDGDYRGCLSLDLEHLDQVLEVDQTSQAARIQAGVFGPHLQAQLRPHGLTLRHFPQSFEFSTLGGWLATRAGGHYATVRPHIDDMVESLRVVTPVGVSESRRLPGSGAGPSPDRLFLGSEGTLGVITEAWMRVTRQPRWRASTSVTFANYEAAVAATRDIAQSALYPANCRLLDAAEALINTGVAVAGGLLVLGFESADHPVDTAIARATDLCREHGGLPEPVTYRGDGPESTARSGPAQTWRSSFLRMPYQRDVLAQHGAIVETFETACTWDTFETVDAAVRAAAAQALREVGATGLLTCRFTHLYPDGPAPYYSVYATGRWPHTVAQWDAIKTAVSDVLAANGATITHHHAVGRDHRPWYDQQRPGVFASALTAAKQALDPAGILNPGALLPVPS